jgi:hypothetical protein
MSYKIIGFILLGLPYHANSVDIYSEAYGEILTVKSKFECKGLYSEKPYFNKKFALLYEFQQTSTSESQLAEVVLYGDVKQHKKAIYTHTGLWTFNMDKKDIFVSSSIGFKDLKVTQEGAEIEGDRAIYLYSDNIQPSISIEDGINGKLNLSCKRIKLT